MNQWGEPGPPSQAGPGVDPAADDAVADGFDVSDVDEQGLAAWDQFAGGSLGLTASGDGLGDGEGSATSSDHHIHTAGDDLSVPAQSVAIPPDEFTLLAVDPFAE